MSSIQERFRIELRLKKNLHDEKKADSYRNAEREAGREEDAEGEQEAK